MSVESGKNVLGNTVHFILYPPSDNPQNYNLQSKYLTRDCPKCQFYIPRERAVQIVEEQIKGNPHKWTPPSVDSILGLCVWGQYPKVLEERKRGPRKCEYFGKERGEGARINDFLKNSKTFKRKFPMIELYDSNIDDEPH